jgi:hypothetical protein
VVEKHATACVCCLALSGAFVAVVKIHLQ